MTAEAMPTVSQFFVMKIASKLGSRKAAREASDPAHAWIQSVARLVFHLAGFACLTYAGFLWHPIAGFVVAGFSLFLMSWVTTGRAQPASAKPSPNHSWATGDRRG